MSPHGLSYLIDDWTDFQGKFGAVLCWTVSVFARRAEFTNQQFQ